MGLGLAMTHLKSMRDERRYCNARPDPQQFLAMGMDAVKSHPLIREEGAQHV
jgi:hypothetical protein